MKNLAKTKSQKLPQLRLLVVSRLMVNLQNKSMSVHIEMLLLLTFLASKILKIMRNFFRKDDLLRHVF